MFTDIFWRFLIIETFVMGALCCSCVTEHPQSRFCKSEFVLRVKIREEIKSSSTKSFRMDIKKVYKGGDSDLIRTKSATLEMDPECPVDSMKTGDKYLIFGNRREGTISTAACYGNLPWEKMTVFYRRAVAKYYKKNCDCSIQAGDSSMQNHCKWNFSFMRKKGTYCKWINTSYFKSCEKGLLKGPFSE